MGLKDQSCTACKGEIEPLQRNKAETLISQIKGWELQGNAKKLHRSFVFKNWKGAMEFVKKLDVLAEKERHHPDVRFGWGYCEVDLQTHSIGGLHENDFIMAAKINALLGE